MKGSANRASSLLSVSSGVQARVQARPPSVLLSS